MECDKYLNDDNLQPCATAGDSYHSAGERENQRGRIFTNEQFLRTQLLFYKKTLLREVVELYETGLVLLYLLTGNNHYCCLKLRQKHL